eukprot:6376574-Pyramimonas_sp.AAC.1
MTRLHPHPNISHMCKDPRKHHASSQYKKEREETQISDATVCCATSLWTIRPPPHARQFERRALFACDIDQ